ncbi:MAG TPA: hypothetical protein VFS43_17210 [Polyangiaceae bacterium]|nr:hypothetical protein [Polyangiaceae bacterium]
MRTSNFALFAALFAALAAAPACAPRDDDGASASTTDAATEGQSLGAGVVVKASYAIVVTGTPTYGNDATEPVLNVEIEVDDAEVRRQHPGFDGYESAFVLVPNRDGAWQPSPLAWKGSAGRGYYAQIRVDLHESQPIFGVDVPTLEALGVAVGLTTNVGTLWAQAPGQNHPVTKRQNGL